MKSSYVFWLSLVLLIATVAIYGLVPGLLLIAAYVAGMITHILYQMEIKEGQVADNGH